MTAKAVALKAIRAPWFSKRR